MSKARRERGGTVRLGTLLEQGDHGEARRQARLLAMAPAAAEAERLEAAAVLASLAPEPGALVVGLGGVVAAGVILGWLLAG